VARAVRRWAVQCPDAVAVRGPDAVLGYAALEARANRLAHRMNRLVGTGPDPVIVLAGHTAATIVAAVACTKLARPMVVVDTTSPADRIRTIAQSAQPVGAFVGEEYRDLAAECGLRSLVIIDDSGDTNDDGGAGGFEHVPAEPDTPIAIVYTSGSTGVPKGVIEPAEGWCAELLRLVDITRWQQGDRVGLPLSLSFALGLSAVIQSLLVGSELCLHDPREAGLDDMLDWVRERELTLLYLTPHAMRSLASSAVARTVCFESLRCVVSAGELLLTSDVQLMRQCTGPECAVFNISGSTEAWCVSYGEFAATTELTGAYVPAGVPMIGKELLLRTEDGGLAADGEPGVIEVVGSTTSPGYWRNPEATAQRWYVDEQGRRVYRTGDTARFRPDGQLEYLGRSDHMLKIRGYLVEPAEVEQHVRAGGEVRDVVVVGQATDTGPVRLVAYVVPEPTRWVSAAAIRRRLARTLPSYMIPQTYVELESLPRNTSNKVDRAALPPVPAPRSGAGNLEGWGSLQIAVAGICASALGLSDIGLDDDLFELGADSLAIEEILAALDSEMGITLTSADLLEYPTVGQLATLPRRAPQLAHGVLVPLRTPGGADTSPLFCVAGAAGLAIAFSPLSRNLGPNRPVYGLQAFGLEGTGLPDMTVQAMARRNMRAVRAVQPSGPYLLAGHSLGAYVAYEMARLLIRAGERVRLLALIDPATPTMELSDEQRDRISPRQSPSDRPDENSGPASAAVREWIFRRWPYLLRRYWRARRDNRFELYWRLGNDIGRRYALPEPPLPVDRAIVFRALDNTTDLTEWAQRFADSPTVTDITGDHMSMMREPFVAEMARTLDEQLAAHQPAGPGRR
jgi:acyl-coenzyme A synthetase/AMP-(fatty) acid ligase/thioesterase domain-containing protein/acyl carrier protein